MTLMMLCLIMQVPDVTERVSVELVLLDILAFDRKGEPVTDLSQDDFLIREGRQKITPTFFERVDMRTTQQYTFAAETIEQTEVPAETSEVVRQRQQLVLVLDLEAVPHLDVARTFDLLTTFVEGLDPAFDYGIEVMSLEYGSYTKGFADNRSIVLEAIGEIRERYLRDTLETSGRGNTLLGSLERRERGNRRQQRTVDLTDLEEELMDCREMTRNPQEAVICMNEAIRNFLEEQYMRTRRVILELQGLAERFEGNNQLKTILLVSPGFSLEGMDSLYELRDYLITGLDTNPAMSSGPDAMGTRSFFKDRNNREEYQKLLHLCMANRIMVNVFDIYNKRQTVNRGISAEYRLVNDNIRSIYSRYNSDITSGTQTVAEDTGGTFVNAFGLGKSMTKVIERSRFSYQIAYPSPPGKSGKWRNIKIKCKRKGVRLQYRNGYYAN